VTIHPLLYEATQLRHEAAERAHRTALRTTAVAAGSSREAAERALSDPYVLATGGLPTPRASQQHPSSANLFGPTAGSHSASVPLVTSGGEGHGRPTASLIFRVFVDVDLTPLRARAAVARTIAAEHPVELVGKRIWLASTSVPSHGTVSGGAGWEVVRRRARFGMMARGNWDRPRLPWAPWGAPPPGAYGSSYSYRNDASSTAVSPPPPHIEAVVRAFDEAAGLHAISCGENASACALLDLARDPATCFWLAPDDALALDASRGETTTTQCADDASSPDGGDFLVTVAAAPRRAAGVLARLGTHLVECAVCFSRVQRRMLARARCCPRFAICEPCARAHAAAALEVVGGDGGGSMVVPAFVRCPAPSCDENLPLATLRERLDHVAFQRLLGAVREMEAAKAATALRRAAAAAAARQRSRTMPETQDSSGGGDGPPRDDGDSAALAQLVGFAQRAGVRFCPACSVSIEKNGGCDHMRCWRCGTDFSWNDAQLLIAPPASPVAPMAASAMAIQDDAATATPMPRSSWELLDDASDFSLRATEFAVGPSSTRPPPAEGISDRPVADRNVSGTTRTSSLQRPDSSLDGDGLLDELARHLLIGVDTTLPQLSSPPPSPSPMSAPPPRRRRAGQQRHEGIVIDD
jgi:hypothetical protein